MEEEEDDKVKTSAVPIKPPSPLSVLLALQHDHEKVSVVVAMGDEERTQRSLGIPSSQNLPCPRGVSVSLVVMQAALAV